MYTLLNRRPFSSLRSGPRACGFKELRNIGAIVDLIFDFLKPFQCNLGEVRTLREILQHQPVVILHSSLLPRAVRLTEVALASQQVIDKAMPRKLETVVRGDRFYVEIAQRRWYFSLIVSLL